ncbi:MAG: STAS/SEC14 domain-containing protein [Akkermansiaceae bacterium]
MNLIYHIREDFTGFDMAAAWDDTKMGLKHLTSWHRLAIVSDVPWIRTGVRAVGFLMPCEVRIFPIAELSEATDWVCEKET